MDGRHEEAAEEARAVSGRRWTLMSSNSNPVHPDKKQMLGVALMVGVATCVPVRPRPARETFLAMEGS